MAKKMTNAAAAKVTPDTGAEPGTEDAKAQDDGSAKRGRTQHPLIGNEDSKVYPFTEVPPDYDFDKHKPLKKRDFAADHMYYTYRAEVANRNRQHFLDLAEQAKKAGSKQERAKAARLVKMQAKVKELRAQLEAQGIDVASLLAGEQSANDGQSSE